jgi:hypothetical protein
MAKNPLQIELVKAPTANAVERAKATIAKAEAANASAKVLDRMVFKFTAPTGDVLELTAREVRIKIAALRSVASSLRVQEDNTENRKAFKAELAKKVARFDADPDKFVNGDPSGQKFSWALGGSAKEQKKNGASYEEVLQQFTVVLGMVRKEEAILARMAELAASSKKKTVKA